MGGGINFGFPFRGGSDYTARLNLNRAVFLDRDGTLIQEREYLSSPDQVAVFPGVGQALRALRQAGFRLFIVSNQSGVGRGLFTLEDVACVHARLEAELATLQGETPMMRVLRKRPARPAAAANRCRNFFSMPVTNSNSICPEATSSAIS